MPSRLLYVGSSYQDGQVYLCDTSHQVIPYQPYATLSHCWGGEPSTKLLQQNLEALTQIVPLEVLPKTFKDAVKLVQHLGIRYIWIDALCIIQDLEEDWRQESLLMNKVYRYSTLNIAASDASDSNGGCFFSREPNIRPDIGFVKEEDGTLTPYYFVQVRSGLLALFEEGPLYRRAWVLQERILPARLLHCGKTQLTWQCRETSASEEYPKSRPEDGTSYYRQVFWRLMSKPNAAPKVVETHGVRNDSTAAAVNLLQRLWRRLVELYSSCSLTNPRDKLIAIAGLAVGMQLILGEYLAGLWETALPRDLLWVTTPSRPGSPPARRSQVYRAPSWSWASIDGEIDYGFPGDIGQNHVSSIERYEVVGSVGEVTFGFLRIRGKLRTARLGTDESTSEESSNHQDDAGCGTIHLVARRGSEQTFIDDLHDYNHPSKDVHVLPISRRNPTAGYSELDYICLVLRKNQLSQFHRIGLCKLEFRNEEFEAWDDYIVNIY
jgi:Heterokaryon incompatibility protein (HET)